MSNEVESLDYAEARKGLMKAVTMMWVLVSFSIIGWFLFCYGISANDKTILVLAGLIAAAAPNLFDYWRKGFGGMFNFRYVNVYADGRKEEDVTGTFVQKLLLTIVVLFLSLVMIIIRAVILLIKFFWNNKKLPVDQRIHAMKMWLPVIIGIVGFFAAFIGGFALSGNVSFEF
jgi:hypothetical protein